MNDNWKTKKIDNFVIVNKVLGKGQYGVVYLGYINNPEQKRIAVKTVPMEAVVTSPNVLNLIKREATILKQVEHPNIVRFYNANRTNNHIYIFLEYCPDGDLRKFIESKKDKHLSEVSYLCKKNKTKQLEAVIFLKHIVEGFKDLFARKIIHRDIKPENILLSNGVAKIADFGFARVIEAEMDEPGKFSRNGSPIYMAPQILRGQPFSAKCDVWSLGIMFFEMLYGKTPWTGDSPFILESNILNKPLKFPIKPVRSQKVKELVAMMLQVDEKDRLSWQQIFEHKVIRMNEELVRQNMNEIMKVEDPMAKSLSLNKIYLDQNLVVGYLNTRPEDLKDDSQEFDGIQQMFNEENPDLILSQYQKDVKRRETFQKIYNYYLYERNVAFFLNFTLQKIIKLQTFNDINIQKEQYFELLFLLCRNQIMHLDRIRNALNSNKHDQFDQDTWGRFQMSRDYQKLRQIVEQDDQQVKDIFKQLLARNDKLSHFKEVGNIKDFLQSYKLNLIQAINFLKTSSAMGKDVFLCIFYLNVCLNPYDTFKSMDFDFNQFYEENENQTMEEVQIKI